MKPPASSAGRAPIFFDTDNACGSMSGDIDDAFAVAALLAADVNLLGACSVFGNTSAANAERNTAALCALFPRQRLRLLSGAATSAAKPEAVKQFFTSAQGPFRYAALGPLTNAAYLLRELPEQMTTQLKELVIVGANLSSKGFLHPFWPHEFNLAKDADATRQVLDAKIPLTICPLDVVKELRLHPRDFSRFPLELRSFFTQRARRWVLRNQILKRRRCFPVWDLAATMYLLAPGMFQIRSTTVAVSRFGKLCFGRGGRAVQVMTSFDAEEVKSAYFQLLSKHFAALPGQ